MVIYFYPWESMLKLCSLENKFSFFDKKERDIFLEGWEYDFNCKG